MAGEGSSTVGSVPLGERPAADELELDVAQARIAAKLFGVDSQVVVGRYRLLELVGRGGMGVVWGAWDPELERKVAIKLVDPLRPAARDRVVAEARALAKLSHPNVVPIYDVGSIDDRVHLVMEWVAGDSVRVYLRDRRTVREIVDVFRQAARGLAAVHAAGLVHRDFKPENAIVGRDGRVRVLDFGLAWADLDRRADDVAGTPRYMAPEQLAGEALTPAVDQYALCIALRDALGARAGDAGAAEVPRWLAKIIARGTAQRPNERFASLDEVIRALGRDPARVLRRRLAIASWVAVPVSLLLGSRLLGNRDVDPCASLTAMPPGWSAARRAAVDARLGTVGGFAASQQPALDGVLDDRERGWGIANRAACQAFSRGGVTAGIYERQLTCLARAGASLVAAGELLAGATAETFPGARVAAGALIDPAQCLGVEPSAVTPPPAAIAAEVRAIEAQIEDARILITAARPDAVRVATEARRRAEATGYDPVVTHALLIEGRARMLAGGGDAAATLDRAVHSALVVRDDVVAVQAFARLAFVTAMQEGRVVDGVSLIEPIAQRLDSAGTFARLLLLNNLAGVDIVINDRVSARKRLEIALREWRPGSSEDDYELASIPQNLAQLVDRPAESLGLLARAREEVARTHGADHPKVIEIERVEVAFIGDLARARQVQDSACARLARLFPHLRDERTVCEYEAGWLADEARDARGASAHFAATSFDATEPVRAEISSRLAAPASAEAARSLERVAGTAAANGSPWTRVAAADAYIAAARIWQSLGDTQAALRCWSRALPVLEALAVPASRRRLARVRAQLARMSPARAAELAPAAIAWYRSVGGYETTVTELERLVEARGHE